MKHVVIIMADQLRADFLGKGMTPHIDALTEQGVRFDHAYCASPLCVPARGAFFTGQYPNENGSFINPWRSADKKYGYVKENVPNLFSLLEADFDSHHSGKQHFLTAEGRTHGNTRWSHSEKDYANMLRERGIKPPGGADFRCLVPELQQGKYTHMQRYSSPHTGCYPHGLENFFDGYFLEGALEAIASRDKNKPLLLNVMFLAPHPPLDIPKPWYDMYSSIEVSENVCKWYPGQSPLQLYHLPGAVGAKYTLEQYRETWRVYAGLVTLLDECVGKVVDALKRENIYDDSLILFTSDHGEMLGSHYLFQKMCMYEESLHVPMIWKFPRHEGLSGRSIAEPVSHIDVLPTLLSWLSKEIPSQVSGLNLMPVIRGETKRISRDCLYAQFDGNGALGNFQRCCRDRNYKVIVDMFKDEIFVELYDVEQDPLESDNLALNPQYRELTSVYIEKIRSYMEQTGDRLHLPATETIMENLRHYDL